MSRLPLAFPPGLYRQGTAYQAKGRFYNANFCRWYGTALGPIGGWTKRSSTTVTGAARAALSWKDNSGTSWLAIGTHSKLYASNIFGTLYDITPSGFTPGLVTATGSGGFGSGTFGTGTFGTPRPGNTQISDATQWTMAPWGQHWVGVSPNDNKIYEWSLNTAAAAVQVTNSPTCNALVVTAEGFIFALGTTDPRTVSWCDQQNDTVWAPLATNQAGDYPLQTNGRLMCGKNVQGGTLLFTDVDVHLATYTPGVSVYGFARKGDACGVISRQAVASFEMKAFWMTPDCHFWQFNGYVQPVTCDVRDYIVQDINLLQASKIYAVHNAANFEIEVYYCSAESTEIDRCVIWTYQTDSGVPHWNIGRVARTCGVDAGTGFQHPIRLDISGNVYDHEVGLTFDGTAPFAETGPIELGSGDNIMNVQGLYPDDNTLGDVTATFFVRNNPDDLEVEYGPYSLASQTDLRFQGRATRLRFDGATMSNWRTGTPRLEVTPGGQR